MFSLPVGVSWGISVVGDICWCWSLLELAFPVGGGVGGRRSGIPCKRFELADCLLDWLT